MGSDGSGSLRRIPWMMGALTLVGTPLWLLRSREACLAFAVGAATNLAYWALHVFLVGRMLTPKLRLRWLYGVLTLGKLALLLLVLRGMMERYPEEGLPLATGLLLFIGAILLEAVWLAFQRPEPVPDDPSQGPPSD